MSSRRAAGAAALAAALALAAPAALAQDAPDKVEIGEVDLGALLDNSVEAVALHREPVQDASASVFVLSGDDVRRQGFRTLEDALRSVPGLFGYADGLYPMIGVRGLGLLGDYTTRLLVLVDGHPLNNSVAIGESYLGRDLPVPLAAVRRIEVIRGPVGNIYGPTAFLGVVNLVTADRAGGRAEAWAEGAAAQRAPRGAELSAAAADDLGEVRWTVSADAYGTRGLDQAFPELARDPGRVAPPGGVVKGADGASAFQSYARGAWRDLSLAASCGAARRGLASAAYASLVGDGRNEADNRTCFAELAWERAVRPGLSLAARVAYDDFHYGDTLAYRPPPAGYGLFLDEGRDHWLSADARADAQLGATHVVAGARVEAHDTLQHSWAPGTPSLLVDPVQGVGVGPIAKSFRTLNAYALFEQRVGRALQLHAGLTVHAHEIFGARATPRLAAVWQPTRDDTLKAIAAEGFRAPTMSEAFFEDGATYLANPALRPETVRSLELVYERRVAGAFSLAASAFHNEYRDLIRFASVPAPGLGRPADPANPLDFRQVAENVGALALRGVELGAILRWRDVVHAWGGLSAQSLDAPHRPNFPDLTAGAAVWARTPWRPLALAASASFVAPRAKDPTVASAGATTRVPAAVVVNARASLDVPGTSGLSLELGVDNALGASAADPVPGDFAPVTEMAQPARTVRFAARWRWR